MIKYKRLDYQIIHKLFGVKQNYQQQDTITKEIQELDKDLKMKNKIHQGHYK